MKTNILNPRALFQQNIRYTIPAFQRHYVWTQDDQWEPLWEDVRNVADDFLDQMNLTGDDAVKAEQQTTPHFLGAIVLQQIPVPVNDIDRREVIDGQQRITTLQLLLDATQFVYEEKGYRRPAAHLSNLVLNQPDFVGEDKTHEFKVWPSRTDREAFRHAMDNGLPVNEYEESLIVQGHDFFQQQVRHWLTSAEGPVERRVQALQTAVTNLLHLVVIDLEHKDDPNVIFETLNARGTQLEQADLIKNFVLSRRPDDEKWQTVWNDLDDTWWLQEVRQGRLRRPRIDALLNYWLAMRTGPGEVAQTRMFSTFRQHADGNDIEEMMRDVNRDMANYRRFEDEKERTEYESLFFYRVNDVMQVRAITPVMLQLLRADVSTREGALRSLESFLVRRMICRMTTKEYTRLTLELTKVLRETGLGQADRIVARFLMDQKAYSSTEWPSDQTITNSMSDSPLYRLLTRGRLRLVLEGIESTLRTGMTETSDVQRDLTIEHLMPVSWKEKDWPLPPDADMDEEQLIEERNKRIHTIGNLTLVTQRLNSSLSNRPWCEKRKTIDEYSTLMLKKDVTNTCVWDEGSIEARSRRMAEVIAECWPGPDSGVWGI